MCFQNFLLTRLDFCGNPFQQFNITYLLRVPARLPKEPEQVFDFLSLHNEPEPRPSRKGWSGSGCCVAIFYCQIQHRTLKIERPSAWDTRRWPRKGSTDDCANRRSKEEVLAQCSNFRKQANSAPQKLAKHKRRAGKRRRKGAGNPCRENGALSINWSKWPVDVVNDAKRHFPEGSSALWLTSCRHFVHTRWIAAA